MFSMSRKNSSEQSRRTHKGTSSAAGLRLSVPALALLTAYFLANLHRLKPYGVTDEVADGYKRVSRKIASTIEDGALDLTSLPSLFDTSSYDVIPIDFQFGAFLAHQKEGTNIISSLSIVKKVLDLLASDAPNLESIPSIGDEVIDRYVAWVKHSGMKWTVVGPDGNAESGGSQDIPRWS